MKRYKRASALLMTLMMLMTMCIIPARADYQSNSNFFQWVAQTTGGIPQHILGYLSGPVAEVCPESDDAKHHAASCVWDGVAGHFICTCDYCGDTFIATKTEVSSSYDDYVHDLPSTQYLNGGYLTAYPYITLSGTAVWREDGVDKSCVFNRDGVCPFFDIGSTYVDVLASADNMLNFTRQINANVLFTAPCSGVYTIPSGFVTYNCTWATKDISQQSYSGSIQLSSSTWSLSANDTQTVCQIIDFVRPYGTSNVIMSQAEIYCEILYQPFGDILDNFTINSRPTSITGDYSVVGDNNEVFVHDETIFNEDNSTFYNPITGDTTTMESWTYDYSTRTYNMVDENDNSTTLTYGDDAIVINDGGNTFNLYYGDVRQTSGGGNGGEGGDTGGGTSYDTGIFGQIGTLLGTLISGLLAGITALLSAILGALTSLVETIGDGFANIVQAILGWFAELPALFSGFLEFLGAVFSFLPSQIISMLSFGIAAVVFIGIIKAIRR